MSVLSAARCLLSSPLIFQDVHDGDRKIVYENSSSIRIEPFGSNESWIVTRSRTSSCGTRRVKCTRTTS